MNSHLEYLLEKGCIDISTVILNETLNEKNNTVGIEIAKALDVQFNGWWKDLKKWVFTDSGMTKTTFTAINMKEAARKLKDIRAAYEKAEREHQTT